MTPVNKENAALLSQCLDFCQTLSSKSLTFSFAFALGNSFSFYLDTSGKGGTASKAKKKKKNPSALRSLLLTIVGPERLATIKMVEDQQNVDLVCLPLIG